MATKPRWTKTDALRRAATANRLAVRHATLLDPYLSPGARDRLLAARATLGDESAVSALGNQKVATAAKLGTAERVHRLIMSIRNAVARTATATAEQRATVGIGEDLDDGNVTGIVAQADRIVAAGASLADCGVIEPVIAALSAGTIALRADSESQQSAMEARADTTDVRTEAHLTLERLVDEISSRGVLACEVAGDAVLGDRFARLVADSGPTEEDEREAGEDETTRTTTSNPSVPGPDAPAPGA